VLYNEQHVLQPLLPERHRAVGVYFKIQFTTIMCVVRFSCIISHSELHLLRLLVVN